MLIWVGSIASGLSVLWAYDNTPGDAAHAPADWPAASRLAPDANGPTLVVLAHPRCTCTAASLDELAELLVRTPHLPRVYVLFLKPVDVSGAEEREWAEDAWLWQRATRIPGVTVVRDVDGREAHRFDAFTSGQAMLYDAAGRLLFSGGLTGARGHAGDNAGRASLLALLTHEGAHYSTTPVFGCPLFAPRAAGSVSDRT
jgi:hypothetical protein